MPIKNIIRPKPRCEVILEKFTILNLSLVFMASIKEDKIKHREDIIIRLDKILYEPKYIYIATFINTANINIKIFFL
jgi:hypothetical protein